MKDKDTAAQAVVAGQPVRVSPGEPILMAMLRNGLGWDTSGTPTTPRGPFCNMGVCQECIVTVAGSGPVRACLTPIKDGDTIDF